MSLVTCLALKKTAKRTRHPQLSLVSPVQVVEHCHLVYIILDNAILIAFEESRFVIYFSAQAYREQPTLCFSDSGSLPSVYFLLL